MRPTVAPTSVDPVAAERAALRWVRSNLGQTTYVQSVELRDATWHATLGAQVPKILYDDVANQARRPVFYEFRDVGTVLVDARTGEVTGPPLVQEVRARITHGLEDVHTSVERALSRVGARELSMLPFGEHMHTPMKNILSWLLYENHWVIDDVDTEPEVGVRWRDVVDRLEVVGLVEREGPKVIVGNKYAEIMTLPTSDEQKVRDAMAFFFSESDISAIRQVVGPHLALGGAVFEDSIEAGEVVPVSYRTLKRRMLETYYGRQKERMLPRYLVQLAEVHLVSSKSRGEDSTFSPVEEVLTRALRQESLLRPLRDRLVKA